MKNWKWIAAIAAIVGFFYAITFIGAGGGPVTVGIKGTIFKVLDLRRDPDRRFPVVNPQRALPEDGAILCSWDRDRFLHFYPFQTPGGYDVAFLDPDGKVLEIKPLRVTSGDFYEEPGITSGVEARKAIFLPEGTATKLKLAPGDQVRLSSALAAPGEPMPMIRVGGHPLHVEVCDRKLLRGRGLMHRPRMSKDEGMLFMYPVAEAGLSYYMRNTLISLDIAYFDDKGALVNVRPTERAKNPAAEGAGILAPADGPAQFVLEVSFGWFQERGLTDAEGKPLKPVLMEISDDLRRRARESETR
jgi:hypothetical protein